MAYTDREGKLQSAGREQQERRWTGDSSLPIPDADGGYAQGFFDWGTNEEERSEPGERSIGLSGGRVWPHWPTEPDVGRVAHGVAYRVDRLGALGNGQVPRVVKTAWRLLSGRIVL